MSDPSDKVYQLLAEIQAKLTAPALNGGFDTLLYKVEKIEETQEKILHEVSSLKDTVYDPDTGIFARIKNIENAESEEIRELGRKVEEISAWKDSRASYMHDIKNSEEKNEEKIREMERELHHLLTWKNSVTSSTKWLMVTLGGGTISLLLKLLYDYLSGHIHFS